MQKLTGDPSTKEYWNNRVKQIPDLKDMLFLDSRREEYWKRIRNYLTGMEPAEVLDICCGFGQFAMHFDKDKYLGVDFSEEMIKLAYKYNPDHKFMQSDAKDYTPTRKFDVIFEVNSLRSLNMTAEQFIEKFKPFAKRAVACLEADQFVIHQIYGTE